MENRPAAAEGQSDEEQFDIYVDMAGMASTGEVDKKIEGMATFIYAMGCERFGTEERSKGKCSDSKKNRRLQRIADIRQELRQLTKNIQEL